MALLTAVQSKVAGAVSTPAAADVAGETFRPDDRAVLVVTNGSASSVTVTVEVPGNTRYGQPEPDVPSAVAAGASRVFGPFPADLADPATGLVKVTYSPAPAATVTRVLIRS